MQRGVCGKRMLVEAHLFIIAVGYGETDKHYVASLDVEALNIAAAVDFILSLTINLSTENSVKASEEAKQHTLIPETITLTTNVDIQESIRMVLTRKMSWVSSK